MAQERIVARDNSPALEQRIERFKVEGFLQREYNPG
jgi:hypothetical protein